jgi:monothiol glutaredoxin
MNESLRKQLAELVSSHRVVLFMKGTRRMPQCGFSAPVVQILDELLPSYETVDVLGSPQIRDGIKEFSDWPTIPQLYVDGQFIGGCDIVREMKGTGALRELLGADGSQPNAPPSIPMPTIKMSSAAVHAFEAAGAGAGADALHLQIDAQFQYDLFFGPRGPEDTEVRTDGLPLLLDRTSLPLANGVSIDFIDGAGGGFKVQSPNEPPKVKELSAPETKAMLDRGELTLFDVRPESERSIAKNDVARSLDAAAHAYLL